ncbi:hypothetical protein MMC11_008411 [Xylographa trunciseda]|nr:hypothetical protein [Xylographa trunciseda]
MSSYLLCDREDDTTARQGCLGLHYLAVLQVLANEIPSARSTLLEHCNKIIDDLKTSRGSVMITSSYILSAMLEEVANDDGTKAPGSWTAKAVLKAKDASSTDSLLDLRGRIKVRVRVLDSSNSDLEGFTLVWDERADLLFLSQGINTPEERFLCCHWKNNRTVLRLKPSSSIPAGWDKLLLQKGGRHLVAPVYSWAEYLKESLFDFTYGE